MNGFKCYLGKGQDGTEWAFVALKPGHPCHGKGISQNPSGAVSWASSAANINRVQATDRPPGKIGSGEDWIIGFDSASDESIIAELQNLTLEMKQASDNQPPQFMIEDFRFSVMPELVQFEDSIEHRRECWDAYVEVCLGNNCITPEQAQKMSAPRGLTTWQASEFL